MMTTISENSKPRVVYLILDKHGNIVTVVQDPCNAKRRQQRFNEMYPKNNYEVVKMQEVVETRFPSRDPENMDPYGPQNHPL